MMKFDEVDRLVGEAATASLKRIKLSRVYSTATTDSDGRDALNVVIVINSDDIEGITGDAALDAIVRIQRDLRASGEDRYAIVEFTTEEELASSGDT